jgi:hypothetical protein
MIRCAFLALFALAALVRGDEEPIKKKLDDKKAEKAIKEYLEKAKATGGNSKKIDDKTVAKVLPSHHFYHLLFRQYPVGMLPPQGLKESNVIAIGPDGKAQALTSVEEMEKFFRANARGLTTDDKAKQAGQAFLRLGRELYQDGFYKFEDDADSFKVKKDKGRVVTGKTTVMQGGSGTLALTLDVGDKGAITSAKFDSKLRAGPRPICQATKLLDADPVVRKMAEQDLLIMGRAAKGDLDEQRKKASPELRKAIDKLWRRIVETDKE